MTEYAAPLRDMQFVLDHLVDLPAIAALPGREDLSAELATAVIEEAGRFANGVLSPLNRRGDVNGARWADGVVTTTPGWIDAYRQFAEGGWNGLVAPTDHGGQNLPRTIATLTEEMWNGSNMAFALCPMLTRGAIEAIELRGSDAIKATYLEKLVSGEWTGTMNLTEPQAGSDLSAVRTRAVPQADGTYRLFGQKIFITYGEHDLTENIIHLVLARTPDAPAGVKGISLFLAPKFVPDADGKPGARNDLICGSIEHKLGIHGSPTCTMDFGRNEGATAWLIGEENRGLEYMFIMMNAARFAVGIQGLGVAERAYQAAVAYADSRVQGVAAGDRSGTKVVIARHPDVRRMLNTMRAQTEAMRAVGTIVGEAMDFAAGASEAGVRAERQAFVDLMIPIVKAWMTEAAIEVTSLAVQVHGGMGFIEETGVAQQFRDARIAAIYEGTTGIQAADLVGRKIARDGGVAARALIARIRETQTQLRAGGAEVQALADRLEDGVVALERLVEFIVTQTASDVSAVLAGSVAILQVFGLVCGGWQLGRSALAAQKALAEGTADAAFYREKLATAEVYAWQLLTRVPGLALSATAGR